MIYEMPSPGPEHERLARLVGTWEGPEDMPASTWGPARAARGRMTMRREIDGFFILQDYEQLRDARVVFRGHGVLGFDQETRLYSWYWVDSMGMPSLLARGTWEDDTLTYAYGSPRGEARYTYQLLGPSTLRYQIENKLDGMKEWQVFVRGTYERS